MVRGRILAHHLGDVLLGDPGDIGRCRGGIGKV